MKRERERYTYYGERSGGMGNGSWLRKRERVREMLVI
jgi:hypothetical protein